MKLLHTIVSHTSQPVLLDMQVPHSDTMGNCESHHKCSMAKNHFSIKGSYLESLREKSSQKKMLHVRIAKPMTFVYKRKHIIITFINKKVVECLHPTGLVQKKKPQ